MKERLLSVFHRVSGMGQGILCGLESHRVGYIELTVRIGLIEVDVG
jgi:hypothetical protein